MKLLSRILIICTSCALPASEQSRKPNQEQNKNNSNTMSSPQKSNANAPYELKDDEMLLIQFLQVLAGTIFKG
jgi:hypothetical protein